MERKSSLAGILLLTIGPLPLVAWLGLRAIRSLEDRHVELARTEALARVGGDLAHDLDALRRDPRAEAGALRRASMPFPLRTSDPALDPVLVLPEPAGEALALPELTRARSRAAEGRWIEALEALETRMQDPDPRLRALALVEAAGGMLALEMPERALELATRAESALAGDDSVAWRRWTSAHRLRHAEGTEPALAALEAWSAEVATRATDLEELVLLGHVLRSLPDDDPRGSALEKRLTERRSRPQWRRWLVSRLARATPGETPILTETPAGWFVAGRREPDLAFRLAGVNQWLEAAQASRHDDGRTIRAAGLPIDLGELTLEVALAETSPFGAGNPRWLLAAGLAIYAGLALLALRAFRTQERRARRLAEMRGDLIAEVTHELRTPLTVLRMYSESLAAERIDPESVPEYLDTIQREAIRLGGLVDQVAETARGEEQADGGFGSCDPVRVLEHLAGDFARLVEVDGGTVETDLSPGTALVAAAEEELRRIFEILLDNAVRYSPPPVRLSLNASIEGDRWIATVRDQGPGIPPAERDRVFERWVRGQKGRSSGGGAGMGLYLAREGARRRGGELTLEFPPDGGTRARVVLPRILDSESES